MAKSKNGEKETKKRVKKAKKELKMVSKGKKEAVKRRKIVYAIETTIVVILAFFMVLLLLNKTFFREEYEGNVDGNTFKINIPLLYYFAGDNDKVVTFKTLRKSEYDKEYFDEYLDKLDRYTCNNEIFYYDKNYNLAIYDIKVEKKFALKTIKISYDVFDVNEVCS